MSEQAALTVWLSAIGESHNHVLNSIALETSAPAGRQGLLEPRDTAR